MFGIQQRSEMKAMEGKRIRLGRTNYYPSLKDVQYTHAVYQLVQHCGRDILYLDGDQTLRRNPPKGCHVANVWREQQRTKRLPQSSDDLEGSQLLVRLR